MAVQKLVVLLTVAVLSAVGGEEEKANGTSVKADADVGTPWLPFFGSFPNFLPGIGLRPVRVPPVQTIRATKTQYVEITRRQTVHPVCYTMYENKSPCLPHRSASSDEDLEMDMEEHHQVTFLSDIKDEEGVDPTDMASMAKPMRDGKYLHFGRRPVKAKDPADLEASESSAATQHAALPPVRETTEFVATRTVLLTKLEKYTDHRVTATMVALNCAPVHPTMPRCRRRVVNPIVEVPIYSNKNGGSIIITPALKLKAESQEEEIEKSVEAVKKVAEAALGEQLQEGAAATTTEGSPPPRGNATDAA